MPPRTQNIFKRGDSYCYCIKIDGVKYRKSFGPNKALAEAALASLKKEMSHGKYTGDWTGLETLAPKKSPKTFAEAAAVYMDERAQLKHSSVETYQGYLNAHLLPRFGSTQLRKISEEDVAVFQSYLIKQGLAPRSVNNVIQMLRSILKVGVRRKDITENPCDGVNRVRAPKADIDPLTFEELELALAHVDPHYKPLFVCLSWTGARPSELLALRWTDINWKRGQIDISKARCRGHEGLPKTRSSERQIPMLPPVIEALTELKARNLVSADGYVFLSKKGEPIGKHLDRIWTSALKRARKVNPDLRHRPSYQLRHTFASLCLQKGAQPGWISKVLGHGSLQITFEYYVRFIPNATSDNERLVAGMFSQPQPLLNYGDT